jgi:hypothetical protein
MFEKNFDWFIRDPKNWIDIYIYFHMYNSSNNQNIYHRRKTIAPRLRIMKVKVKFLCRYY